MKMGPRFKVSYERLEYLTIEGLLLELCALCITINPYRFHHLVLKSNSTSLNLSK